MYVIITYKCIISIFKHTHVGRGHTEFAGEFPPPFSVGMPGQPMPGQSMGMGVCCARVVVGPETTPSRSFASLSRDSARNSTRNCVGFG